MSSKQSIEEILKQISILHYKNKSLEKYKTDEMKKMLQNVINRYQTIDDKIKVHIGGKKKKKIKKEKIKRKKNKKIKRKIKKI